MSNLPKPAGSYTLVINKVEFTFNVEAKDIDRYINALMPDEKIAPLNNLLVTTVQSEQQEALLALIEDNAPAIMQIGGVLVEQFTQKIDIEVKKP